MVRIYGSGVPDGEVEDDSFGTREAVARDAALEEALKAKEEAARREEASGGRDGVAATTASGGAARGAAGAAARGAASSALAGLSPEEAMVAADIEEFRAEALARFDGMFFGDEFATVAAVKAAGACGDGDNGFLESPLGDALRKSLESLGHDPWALCGIWMGEGASAGDARTLRQIVELVDPIAVVAVDSQAGKLLAQAFSDSLVSVGEMPDACMLETGDHAATVAGRKHVFLRDFEGSLDDQDAKRRAWAALRTIRR